MLKAVVFEQFQMIEPETVLVKICEILFMKLLNLFNMHRYELFTQINRRMYLSIASLKC